MDVVIRALTSVDEPGAEGLLDTELGGRWQARLGEMVDVLALPGFVAVHDDRLLGVATLRGAGGRAELAAIVVAEGRRHADVGSALLEAAVVAARRDGAGEMWLVTTNDNIDALRFYQRRGFRLAELHVGGVERSRRLKPSISEVGSYGIRMRDELILIRATGID